MSLGKRITSQRLMIGRKACYHPIDCLGKLLNIFLLGGTLENISAVSAAGGVRLQRPRDQGISVPAK